MLGDMGRELVSIQEELCLKVTPNLIVFSATVLLTALLGAQRKEVNSLTYCFYIPALTDVYQSNCRWKKVWRSRMNPMKLILRRVWRYPTYRAHLVIRNLGNAETVVKKHKLLPGCRS